MKLLALEGIVLIFLIACGEKTNTGNTGEVNQLLTAEESLDACNEKNECTFQYESCNSLCLQGNCEQAANCATGDIAYDACLNNGSCEFPDNNCNQICESDGCDEALDCSIEAAYNS